jgi:hypothetical protein
MLQGAAGRSSDGHSSGPPLPLSRRHVLGMLSAAGMLAGLDPIARPGEWDAPELRGGVTYTGRVIELETGKPVGGAEILLERSIRGAAPPIPPAWLGETSLKTDADGRFRLDFPPEQVAEPGLCITLKVRHPGFIHRKSYRTLLADIIRGQSRGEPPFFATITLEAGLEYAGQVVTPGGRPAAGIPYWFEFWMGGKNSQSPLHDDTEGQTDGDGRIRVRMAKTWGMALYLGPPQAVRARFPYAPYQHFWGTDTPGQHPDVWAPTDLGRIVLSRGIRLPGRMVDTEGRPIAGQTVTAYAMRGRLKHTTVTEVDGGFALGPLRPGNYLIFGEGQDHYGGFDHDIPPLRRPIRVVRPARVYLQEGVTPEPLVLREMPTVRVSVRFVDSRGKPVRGSAVGLRGLVPNDGSEGPAPGARVDIYGGRASQINDPEPRDTVERDHWGTHDQPSADGRIILLVPKGLREATVSALPFDETTSYKVQLEPNRPLKSGGGGGLGVLESDRQITVVSYRAPTVLVTVKSQEGPLPDEIDFNGGRFTRQPDGRYRSVSLVPDHVYEISAWAKQGAYVPTKFHRIRLPEGGSAELTLTVRKRPGPAQVGKPAPGFSVRTIDGRQVDLAGLKGKTVLLHFWQPLPGMTDAASLLQLHHRFGKDARFEMIGFCLSGDSDGVARIVRSIGVSWPQALLRDRTAEPIAIEYGVRRYPYKSFLVGPDGHLIARDLEGAALEKSVADILGGR